MTELLGVLDVWKLDRQRPKVAAWAQAVGIDAREVWRIELRYDGRLYARVHAWKRGEDGYLYCVRDHDHQDFSENCETAQREPYDVTIISAAGPEAIRDRWRAHLAWKRHGCVALAPVIAVVRAHQSAMRTAYATRRRARARRNR